MAKQAHFQEDLAHQNSLLSAAARERAQQQREENLMLMAFIIGFLALISSPFWFI